MFHGFIALVQGSNPPYGMIMYGTYAIKYSTVRNRTVPYGTVNSEIGKIPPEGYGTVPFCSLELIQAKTPGRRILKRTVVCGPIEHKDYLVSGRENSGLTVDQC